MKKTTLNLLVLTFFCMPFFLFAQEKQKVTEKHFNQELTDANLRSFEETGFIKCETVEYEAYLQNKFPKRATTDEFENWIAPKAQLIKQQIQSGNFRGGINMIPVIFHVITDGVGGDNLSAAAIQAQLDQLNIDYANLAGSSYGSAADTQIQFCLAQVDENGVQLNEPGINRVTTYGGGPFSTGQIQSNIKADTQWDPEQYMNIWTANISGGILGYAQFPDPAGTGIDGLDPGDVGPVGAANTDGVVIAANSVGSVANPNPLGAPYNKGRTLTHEAGHWLGLRHIWGDNWAEGQPNNASCGDDDFCADTPNSGRPNFGCPTGINTCPTSAGIDMIENYMDYTDDSCMDTFTANQVSRVLAVITNSPRRANLLTSTACQPAMTYNLDAKIDIANLNTNCSDYSITPELTITNKGYNTLTSATITYNLDGGTNTNINWTGSLALDESESIFVPQINTAIGSHVFNVTLSNPNGGTDEQPANNTDSGNFEVTGSPCASVANTNFQTSTTGVIFNSISNLNTGKPSGYSDYTASQSTDVNREETYDLTVNANSDGNYQIITYAWIDWNQNCSFDDPGEQYDLGTSANINNQPTVNSPLAITIPANAVLGNTTMRITTKYTDPNANQFPTSCENGHDGEVEDYTINVLAQLSVNEFTLNNIGLYPNPTTNVLNISLANANELPDNYTIYNMLGQVVLSKNIAAEADLSINTSSLSNGMYFIKIAKDSSQVSLPFIKK